MDSKYLVGALATGALAAVMGFAVATHNGGLAAYWPFNEGSGTNANDVEHNHDGTINGGATYTSSGIAPVAGNTHALSFDGTSGFVDVPHHADLDVSTYTISTWANVTDTVTYRPILFRGTTNANDIEVYVQTGSNDLIVAHNRGNGGTFDFVGFSDPPIGTLFHLAVTFDGTDVLAYYDGVPAAVTQQTTAVEDQFDTNKGWWIGKVDHASFGGTNFFKGLLDEMRLYNRALTPAEVAVLATPALIVDDDKVECPNAGYTDIQSAVTAAGPGDTITVCAGTYASTTVGAGKDNLHIKAKTPLGSVDVTGGGTDGFLLNSSDGVEIRGFEIFGYAAGCGVRITDPADEADINRNLIRNNFHGVCLLLSNDNEVERNTIHSHAFLGDGVRLIPGTRASDGLPGGLDNDIERNTVRNNLGRAIFVGDDACPSTPKSIADTSIERNELFGNGSGASNAMVLRSVLGGEVERNSVHNNSVPNGGIRVDCDTTGLSLERNTVNSNSIDGISIDDAHTLTVERNAARFNGDNGIEVTVTDGSTFERNDGRGNTGTDLVADAGSALANTFDRNRCDEALPSTAAWDC